MNNTRTNKTPTSTDNSGTRRSYPSLPTLALPNCARTKNVQAQNYDGMTDIIPKSRPTPNIATINVTTPRLTPKTPIVIPKVGTVKRTPTVINRRDVHTPDYDWSDDLDNHSLNEESSCLEPGENPWLPPKADGISDIKIAAITPIGTIAMVPTSDERPIATPRKPPLTPGRHLTLRVIDKQTGNVTIDPLLTSAIYLDCTKQSDQDYHHVANHMRTIAANTSRLQKQYSTEFRPLINVAGKVSYSVFEEALSIYENNQVYYQNQLDDRTADINAIGAGLTTLEHWFACIIEPKPQDDPKSWIERELTKITNGITIYCDPELHKYIRPFTPNIISLIKQYQNGLS